MATVTEHYNNLDTTHQGHANALANHYKGNMHPTDKAALEKHAANDDHASMLRDIKLVAAGLGITFSTAGAIGVAHWALKWFKR